MIIIELIKNIEDFFKQNKGSIAALILVLIVIAWGLFEIPFTYYIWNIDIKIIIGISTSILCCGIWLYLTEFKIDKNKSNLLGVAFMICSEDIAKVDLEKNSFFQLLKNEAYGKFKILIYSKKKLERILKKDENIMSKLNLTLMFEVKERNGNIDNDHNYELEIVATYCNLKFKPNPYIINNLLMDFNKSISKHIVITHKNSLSDSKNEVNMINLSTSYLIAILKIISGEPDTAFKLLDEISYNLNNIKAAKKERDYIKKNLVYRYLEAYYNSIYKILETEPYYSDNLILDKAELLLNNMYKYLISAKSKGIIAKQAFDYYYECYLMHTAIVVYQKNGAQKALEIINKCDFSRNDNIGIYFNKAFLLMMSDKMEDSINLYLKIFKRKDIDENIDIIEEVLDFINQRLYLNPKNEKLELCYAIINFFKKDKVLANEIFEKLSKKNDDKLNEQIMRIKNLNNSP